MASGKAAVVTTYNKLKVSNPTTQTESRIIGLET